MDKKISLIAARACQAAYKKNKKIGSTNYKYSLKIIRHKCYVVVAIVGTNDLLDWFWNLCPITKDGVKYGSYLSARRIRVDLREWLFSLPMIITGHSKAGPTAAYFKKKYCRESDHSIIFSPAPGFLKSEPLTNSIIFRDKDDLVPWLGAIRFKHPVCEVEFLPKDKKWWDVFGRLKDHPMSHIVKYLEEKNDG